MCIRDRDIPVRGPHDRDVEHGGPPRPFREVDLRLRIEPVGAVGQRQPLTAQVTLLVFAARPAPARPVTAKVGAGLRVELFEDLDAVSYTHLRAHETDSYLVCRL